MSASDDHEVWRRGVESAAGASGKPQEVQAAQAFLNAGWTANLTSYYRDDGAVRELDVLATKESIVPGKERGILVRFRALVSCKGFRSMNVPVAYSVSKANASVHAPSILQRCFSFNERQPLDGRALAGRLIADAMPLDPRPLVSFDVVERTDLDTKKKGVARPPLFKSLGDHALFEGLDSAQKAACYWVEQDKRLLSSSVFACHYLPVLVLSKPFWVLDIENSVHKPPVEQLRRGYHVSQYPVQPPFQPEAVLSVIWSIDQVSSLVATLDRAFDLVVTQLSAPT